MLPKMNKHQCMVTSLRMSPVVLCAMVEYMDLHVSSSSERCKIIKKQSISSDFIDQQNEKNEFRFVTSYVL
jgi:hypothetical protein